MPALIGRIGAANITVGPTGWRANSKLVTTPKLPPPPRSAQNRSSFSVALAGTTRPSAVTTSADTRLSIARPYRLRSQPMPPLSVSPPTPVSEISPPGVARPNSWVAWSTAAHVAPPSTTARAPSGSTRTAFIGERSTMTPPSATACPATLCPPPRTETGWPCSAANVTAATTSALVRQRTITPGRRSIIAFQTARASSYPASPDNEDVAGDRSSQGVHRAERPIPRSTFRFVSARMPIQSSASWSTAISRPSLFHPSVPESVGCRQR